MAVTTVMSKLFEHYILSCIFQFLRTTDNQFGFKAGYGTDQWTFLLKQIVSYFVNHGLPVRAVFWMPRKHLTECNTLNHLQNVFVRVCQCVLYVY